MLYRLLKRFFRVGGYVWLREDGIEFIKLHRADAMRHGYDLALGGSLLYDGWSKKDLDIICIFRGAGYAGGDTALRANYVDFKTFLEKTFPNAVTESCHSWNGRAYKYTCVIEGRLVDWIIQNT